MARKAVRATKVLRMRVVRSCSPGLGHERRAMEAFPASVRKRCRYSRPPNSVMARRLHAPRLKALIGTAGEPCRLRLGKPVADSRLKRTARDRVCNDGPNSSRRRRRRVRRTAFRNDLGSLGHQVYVPPRAALRPWSACAPAAARDLVLVDLQMEEMDGLKTIDLLREVTGTRPSPAPSSCSPPPPAMRRRPRRRAHGAIGLPVQARCAWR